MQTDAFVSRFNSSGELLWSRQIGTDSFDHGFEGALDPLGNLYVAGKTSGVLGASEAGSGDVFVMKLDANGQRLWTSQFGSPNGDEVADIVVDAQGNLLVAGSVGGSLDGQTPVGLYDAFAGKLGSDGSVKWLRQFGMTSFDFGSGIAEDGHGGAFLVGSVDWDSAQDLFVAHYDANGELLDSDIHGTEYRDIATGVVPDGRGGLMMTATQFIHSLSNPLEGDYYGLIERIDSNGEVVWQERILYFHSMRLQSIDIDGTSVYVAGAFEFPAQRFVPANDDAILRKYTIVPEPASWIVGLWCCAIVYGRRSCTHACGRHCHVRNTTSKHPRRFSPVVPTIRDRYPTQGPG